MLGSQPLSLAETPIKAQPQSHQQLGNGQADVLPDWTKSRWEFKPFFQPCRESRQQSKDSLRGKDMCTSEKATSPTPPSTLHPSLPS